jgi:hypothetical protein
VASPGVPSLGEPGASSSPASHALEHTAKHGAACSNRRWTANRPISSNWSAIHRAKESVGQLLEPFELLGSKAAEKMQDEICIRVNLRSEFATRMSMATPNPRSQDPSPRLRVGLLPRGLLFLSCIPLLIRLFLRFPRFCGERTGSGNRPPRLAAATNRVALPRQIAWDVTRVHRGGNRI